MKEAREKGSQPEKESDLYRLRHSLAHIMAQAVLELRPKAKLGFGPPVETGFYYDFDFGDAPLGEGDLAEVEKRMRKIIKQRQPFRQVERSLDEAEALLGATEQAFKIEYANELVETGKAGDGRLGFYENGTFTDMCEGPHLEHTGEVPKGCFRLDKIAGSYWRGDEKRPQLTRIYGLAFPSREELEDFVERRRLAMERDHRKLGAELDLFAFDDEVGVGLPLWLPNGAAVRDELESWAKEEEFRAGYQRVSTPIITKSTLYYTSGHLPYYKDSMYPPMQLEEGDEYYLRPMNCPHHHKVYAARMRSYRDLPLKLAEYGNTYRYEKHGSLAGLLRVRAMCMNDAHMYCEYAQVEEVFNEVMAMYRRYYDHLRLGDFRVRLSLHAQDSSKFVGNEEEWQRSEQIVRQVLAGAGIDFDEEAGEAAFYGPKADIQLKNVLGREETVSTCQLDFVMAQRFGLEYTSRGGQPEVPYIIHRAPLSTHERMISFLIERYGGAFPTWMAPVQVRIVPVGEHAFAYGREVARLLSGKLFRAQLDEGTESFNKKIRNAVTRKIPNIWILGAKEAEARTVTWRRYCVKEQVSMTLDRAVDALMALRAARAMDNFADVPIPDEA